MTDRNRAALEALEHIRGELTVKRAYDMEEDFATIRAALTEPAADAEREKAARELVDWAQDARDHGSPRVPISPDTLDRLARLLRSVPSPASPAAEPVAWRFPDEEDDGHWYIVDGAKRPPGTEYIAGWEPLYAAPPAQEGEVALDLLHRFVALVPEPPLVHSYDQPPEHRTQEEHELGYTLHLAKELLAAPQAEPALWRTGMTEAETDAALAAHPPEQPAATDSEREECARWLDEQVKRLERDDIFGERRTRLVQAARLLRGKP